MSRTVTGSVVCVILLGVLALDLGIIIPPAFGAQASLRISDFTIPPTIVAGEPFTARVSVKWSGFDRNAGTIVVNQGTTLNVQPPVSYSILISIEQYSLIDENVRDSGSKTYDLQVSLPSAGPWKLAARLGLRVLMETGNNTVNLMNQDVRELAVDVAPAVTMTPPGVTELALDDGGAETGFGFGAGSEGGVEGVRFTAPSTPFQLLKVRYYLQKEPQTPFAVLIWDQDRSPLFEQEVVGETTGWFDVDLSTSNLFLSGAEFYVMMKAIDRGMKRTTPYLGWDTGQPDGNSFAQARGGTWMSSAEMVKASGVADGDFMIRAWVQVPKDTDGDSLYDFQETALGTNPESADTDSDGLNDAEEISIYKTDPLKPDSDLDGLGDGAEVERGTNPLIDDTDQDFWNDSVDTGPRDALMPNVLLVVAVVVVVVALLVVLRRRAS